MYFLSCLANTEKLGVLGQTKVDKKCSLDGFVVYIENISSRES